MAYRSCDSKRQLNEKTERMRKRSNRLYCNENPTHLLSLRQRFPPITLPFARNQSLQQSRKFTLLESLTGNSISGLKFLDQSISLSRTEFLSC